MEEIIMNRQGCTRERAEIIVQRLRQIDERLFYVLQQWLETGKIESDTFYHGYSLKSLMEDYGMYFTGALLTVDWILKDPASACQALAEGMR